LTKRSWPFKIDLFALLSVIIPFSIYLLTLAPSVTFFDSGEFITAIHSLGSPHSPGYPLFVQYAKPFTWLPFGNIAYRVNIATAISAGLACFGVYLLVRHLLVGEESVAEKACADNLKKLVALCASLIFAFSARLWLQSNHDKPYPLFSFLAAMIFYLLFLWREKYRKGEEKPVCLSALIRVWFYCCLPLLFLFYL
jgi:4-amino-4-deoxy-L-arabinose transferase-like glycosyltransferase